MIDLCFNCGMGLSLEEEVSDYADNNGDHKQDIIPMLVCHSCGESFTLSSHSNYSDEDFSQE